MTTTIADYAVIQNTQKKVADHGWKMDVQPHTILLDYSGGTIRFTSFTSVYDWICGYEFGDIAGFKEARKKFNPATARRA